MISTSPVSRISTPGGRFLAVGSALDRRHRFAERRVAAQIGLDRHPARAVVAVDRGRAHGRSRNRRPPPAASSPPPLVGTRKSCNTPDARRAPPRRARPGSGSAGPSTLNLARLASMSPSVATRIVVRQRLGGDAEVGGDLTARRDAAIPAGRARPSRSGSRASGIVAHLAGDLVGRVVDLSMSRPATMSCRSRWPLSFRNQNRTSGYVGHGSRRCESASPSASPRASTCGRN